MANLFGSIATNLLSALGQASQGVGSSIIERQGKIAEKKMELENKLELQKSDPIYRMLALQHPEWFQSAPAAQGGLSQPQQAVADSNKEALDWARANPDDPRAKKYLQQLGF